MTATTAGRVRSLPFLRALGTRDFRLLWTSEAISLIGDQFHFVALSWLVITLTGSGLAVGTALIAIAVPRAILLGPFGVVADRRPGRTLMLTAHIVRGLTVGAIAALVVTGGVSIPLLAILGAVFGGADALYMPAQQAFLPRTLDADRLPSANALLQGTYQITSIVGPPIAGVVIAVSSTGVAFAVDAVSFVLAAIVIAMLSRTAPVGTVGADAASDAPAAHEPFLAAIGAGIGYVLRDRTLLLTMAIALVLNLALNGPVMVRMPWLLSLALSGLLVDLNATAMFVGAGLLVLGTAIVVAASGWVAMFDAPPPAAAGSGAA